jgi:magnesium chelatase family protein
LAACKLGIHEQGYLEEIARKQQLSGRGIMRSLAVARSIADLEASPVVRVEHLLEAVTYRYKEEQ